MEQKQELSSIDLRALVTETRRYTGAKVDKAYLYGDDLLRLKLRDFDHGRVELMVEVGDVKRAHAADPDNVGAAPGRPPNFAKMLRNRLSGADFVGVEQHGFDRILTFDFEREDQNTRIVAELFGQGNVAVLDESGEVVQSLDTVRLRSRTVAPGAVYEYPGARLNPLDISFDAFRRRMDESDTDVVRTLATQLNLGGLYAEEVCSRARVEKTTDIPDVTDEDYRELYDAIARIDERLHAGDIDPRVYEADDGAVDVTPFPLVEHEDLPSEGYDSFTAAVDDYFYRLDRAAEEEVEGGETAEPDFDAEITKQQRIVEQQEEAIEGFEQQAERERERAELLYANYDLVDEVLSTVQDAREAGVPWEEIEETLEAGAAEGIEAAKAVRDVDGGEATVTVRVADTRIELDATAGVEVNADGLYTEAKRVEEKKAGAEEALAETRAELEAVKQRREEWDADDEQTEAESEGDDEEFEAVDWLARSSVPVRSTDNWYERFRWFRTSDDYLVIGGRNADQNEELVKKYTDKHDRFFHTDAHGGPVTILKAAGPSESAEPVDFSEATLREAAQFAVSYSSDWKAGRGAADAYMVDPDQVSKTPESGEYLEKGGFAIRGDRTYFEDVPCRVAGRVRTARLSRPTVPRE